MIPLYTEEEYNNTKSDNLLKFKCEYCGNEFYQPKKWVKHCLSHQEKSGRLRFCSHECCNLAERKTFETVCANCGKPITSRPGVLKKSKSGNLFCSSSCAATYNNTHKTYGTRRSKLEAYIEEKLSLIFPSLEILYNDKTTINSELDIYIPSLKLAFELNGLFHYEPIFGDKKLLNIQKNDENKFELCSKNGISLCIIDTSSLKYFKELSAQKYLDVIVDIIKQNLEN